MKKVLTPLFGALCISFASFSYAEVTEKSKGAEVVGQQEAAEEQKAETENDSESKSPWSFSIGGTYSSNAFKPGTTLNNQSLSIDLAAGYKLSENRRLSFVGGVYQELTSGREDSFTDILIGYHRSRWLKPNDFLTVGYAFRIQLPTSESATEDYRRWFALRAQTPVSVKLSEFGVDDWSLSYTPQISRGFYEQEGGANYDNVVEWTFSQSVGLSGSFADDWGVGVSGYFRTVKPFNEGWKSPRYGFSAELSYSYSDDIEFSTGYSNQGAIYKNEVGSDETFALYDKETASFFVSTVYSF